jgi:hypothetical protein
MGADRRRDSSSPNPNSPLIVKTCHAKRDRKNTQGKDSHEKRGRSTFIVLIFKRKCAAEGRSAKERKVKVHTIPTMFLK